MRNTHITLGFALSAAAASAGLAACAAAPPAAPFQYRSEYKTTVGLMYGQRSLSSDYDPVDDQQLVGLDFDVRQEGETVGFEMDYLHSGDDETSNVAGVGSVKFHSKTNELSAGARWMYEPFFGDVRPYLGLGLSSIWVEFDSKTPGLSKNSDSTWAPGAYAHAGLWWAFDERFGVGLDYRKEFFTSVSLENVNTDVNYGQFAITLGYSF